MRRRDRIAEVSDILGKLSPPILVVIGVALAGLFVWRSNPTNIAEFSTLADMILKLMAIAIAGLILPRLAGFKVGGAEFSLRDESAEIGETVNRLARKVEEIEVRLAGMGPAVEGHGTGSEPYPEPKLPAPFTKVDIQKGRFGGLSKVGDFEIVARFPTASSSSQIVRVVLEVRKLKGDFVAPVRFYLHDSYSKPTVDVRPVGDRAKLEVLAWGGFTVGVWLKETADTLLELDLAELDYAPRVIREL